MATRARFTPAAPLSPRRPPSRRGSWGVAIGLLLLLAVVAGVLAMTMWSGVTLSSDPVALARLQTQPFAGSLESAVAHGPDGRAIPLSFHDGRLTPLTRVAPGELISVDVTVRRPAIIAWALGSTRTEHLTVRAPAAHVVSRWLTVPAGSPLRVSFDQPVSAVAYGRHPARTPLPGPERTVPFLAPGVVGSIAVAAAVRPWESLGAPVTVTWFPPPAPGSAAAAVVQPAPGSELTPGAKISLRLSRPVAEVFGSSRPRFEASMPGSWRVTGPNTLVFTPTGLGVPLFAGVRLVLPRAVTLTSAHGVATRAQSGLAWQTPPASTLRLRQLLAQQGYLPVSWSPRGHGVPRTAEAQLAAAVAPPGGTFTWRYANTPAPLQALWKGSSDAITRGAVMMFEQEHGLVVDGVAGPMVWHALLADQLAGRRRAAPYSYVYVHTRLPQKLTLWSGGHVVLTSPGNTGVASAPTKPGTYPVFEHIPVGTMSGTNPGGSHYNDPGIRWISYFNGGDAIHAFNRASFGTPQSLGCVELPLAAAAVVWPYTPIGTLVTIED
jgi:hypothetical protein